MADVPKLLEAASRWQHNFKDPLPLGANARLAIITCMDSRYADNPPLCANMLWSAWDLGSHFVSPCSVHPERMFDLKIGDAEVLRNAGGRVTLDMIR